jgi:hypothetical protein
MLVGEVWKINIMENNFFYKEYSYIQPISEHLQERRSFVETTVDFLPILITIIGWGVIFYLQKRQIRDNAKIKIYEELQDLKKNIDDININFAFISSGLLFLDMEWAENSSNPTKLKMSAFEHWMRYTTQLNEQISNFTFAYLNFLNHIEMWMGVMPRLKKAKNTLFTEFRKLNKKLSDHQLYLLELEYDWKIWDQEDIKKHFKEINSEFDAAGTGFVDDFMVLVHNLLVSPIFGYKKRHRENFANLEKLKSYKILTIDGLVEVINKN